MSKTRTGCGHRGKYGRFSGKPSGRWKGGVPCRCSRCGMRKTLKRRPSELKRKSDGMCCGKAMYVDWSRHSGAEHKANACSCGGYHFTHRRGSLFCVHGAAGTAGFCFMDRGNDSFKRWDGAGRPSLVRIEPREMTPAEIEEALLA